jgi:AraC family transcriptional regulator
MLALQEGEAGALSASEIFIRDAVSGGAVRYSHHAMRFCSSEAPWRELIRLERCRKALESTEVSLLWTGIALAQSEGDLDYRFDGQPLRSTRLKPGDLFVYPQGASMYLSMPLPVELTCIQVAPAVTAAIAEETGCSPEVLGEGPLHAEHVMTMAALLEAEVRSGYAGGKLYGEHLAYAFAAQLIQGYGASAVGARNGRLQGGRLAAVLEYIHARANEDLSLHDLARVARLSPFHFSRLFKSSTGVTPHQYVLQWRIEEAKRLLRHGRLQIADIAQQLGFRDQSHFTARFRRITGATPKRWREGA